VGLEEGIIVRVANLPVILHLVTPPTVGNEALEVSGLKGSSAHGDGLNPLCAGDAGTTERLAWESASVALKGKEPRVGDSELLERVNAPLVLCLQPRHAEPVRLQFFAGDVVLDANVADLRQGLPLSSSTLRSIKWSSSDDSELLGIEGGSESNNVCLILLVTITPPARGDLVQNPPLRNLLATSELLTSFLVEMIGPEGRGLLLVETVVHAVDIIRHLISGFFDFLFMAIVGHRDVVIALGVDALEVVVAEAKLLFGLDRTIGSGDALRANGQVDVKAELLLLLGSP